MIFLRKKRKEGFMRDLQESGLSGMQGWRACKGFETCSQGLEMEEESEGPSKLPHAFTLPSSSACWNPTSFQKSFLTGRRGTLLFALPQTSPPTVTEHQRVLDTLISYLLSIYFTKSDLLDGQQIKENICGSELLMIKSINHYYLGLS